MDASAKTIPIQGPAVAAAGCGQCLQSRSGPVCRSAVGAARGRPRFDGPPAEVARLLAALAPTLGTGLGTGSGIDAAAADGHAHSLVQGLSVQDGEVTLVLAMGRQCGGAELADAAFHTLRGLLPDTDIYVQHAA